ncbi:MAG: diacylglycerol kinase [Epsilonproteobacteria bacterium]|nr:diacylglycerol kinase [Campylobacterota bacterium]
MLNKPKYNLFKNTSYALAGLKDIIETESSFRAQLFVFAVLAILAVLLPLSYIQKSIMVIILFLPLLSEIANSAIERTVDLVTKEHHELAKKAKDAGATMVFMSYFVVTLVWIVTLLY